MAGPVRTYSFAALEKLWLAAGGDKTAAPYAAAIALAESGGNPNDENHNENGSIDRGLWQINSVHGKLSTTSVFANAQAAVAVFKEAGGFTPWVTYNKGTYKDFLTPTNLKSGVPLEKGAEPQAGLFGIVEGKIPGFSKEGSLESSAEKAIESLGPPNWTKLAINVVLLLAGAVLVIYGIMVAVGRGSKGLPVPVPV